MIINTKQKKELTKDKPPVNFFVQNIDELTRAIESLKESWLHLYSDEEKLVIGLNKLFLPTSF